MNNVLFESLLREAELYYNRQIQLKIDSRREARIRAEIMRQQMIIDNMSNMNVNRKLEVRIINETMECPICMITKDNIVLTRCNHKFCMDCIKEIKSGKCPYCRQC
jgi:hypothetical protein